MAPRITFYASGQNAVAPSCDYDSQASSLVSIATGRKFFTEVACAVLSSVSIENGKEGRRSTAAGSASERLMITLSRLSIPIMQLRNSGQIFVKFDCGCAWEGGEGAIEGIWIYGSSIIKVLIDPAKKMPVGGQC